MGILGYLYGVSGDANSAIEYQQKALEQEPKDAQCHLVMGRIKMSTDRVGARTHFNFVQDNAPGSVMAGQARQLLQRISQ